MAEVRSGKDHVSAVQTTGDYWVLSDTVTDRRLLPASLDSDNHLVLSQGFISFPSCWSLGQPSLHFSARGIMSATAFLIVEAVFALEAVSMVGAQLLGNELLARFVVSCPDF